MENEEHYITDGVFYIHKQDHRNNSSEKSQWRPEMQTVKIFIPGSYYDSQIYQGRLYLWCLGGSIMIIDWNTLIEGIHVPEHLRLAIRCAFQQSEYFYGSHWKPIFQDDEVRKVIQHKFRELSEAPIEISINDLHHACIHTQDNPFPFPHASCVMYNNTLYIGSRSGVFGVACNQKSKKKPLSDTTHKLWDGTTLEIAAAYSTLALSAGNEGVFEHYLSSQYTRYPKQTRQLLHTHSNAVRWMYASVFSSSYFNEGYLVDCKLEKTAEKDEKPYRILDTVVPSGSIFGEDVSKNDGKFVWGFHDKLYVATKQALHIVRYQHSKASQERFVQLEPVGIEPLQGDIISADSALFGIIIETDNGLIIMKSDLETLWLEGEPVNWCIFPKSKYYTNQLHVVYEDHLCIHSFNHDYFVNQDTKSVGIAHAQTAHNWFHQGAVEQSRVAA